MNEEQCKAFVVQSVSHAMARDGSSGGNIRTVVINSTGIKKEFLDGTKVWLFLVGEGGGGGTTKSDFISWNYHHDFLMITPLLRLTHGCQAKAPRLESEAAPCPSAVGGFVDTWGGT
jgi:hypothetical protein